MAYKQDVGHGGFVSFPGCISPYDYTMARLELTQSIFPKAGAAALLAAAIDCLSAKAGAAGGGAYAPFLLTARWLGWLC